LGQFQKTKLCLLHATPLPCLVCFFLPLRSPLLRFFSGQFGFAVLFCLPGNKPSLWLFLSVSPCGVCSRVRYSLMFPIFFDSCHLYFSRLTAFPFGLFMRISHIFLLLFCFVESCTPSLPPRLLLLRIPSPLFVFIFSFFF